MKVDLNRASTPEGRAELEEEFIADMRARLSEDPGNKALASLLTQAECAHEFRPDDTYQMSGLELRMKFCPKCGLFA